MASTPLLSVIVPVHQGAAVLPVTLRALAASDFSREQWELIVVDDASTDASAAIAAEWADRVLRLPETSGKGPHGPAFARNRGTAASTGTWLVFIDADVAVHTDTLSRIASIVAEDASLVAVIGAYDAAPSAPGFHSQYRNLLHHYTHLLGRGDAETFWAGCGAVRRTAFDAAGGFDETRYRRPQIEDIELGYRLRDRGGRIALRPDVQGTHLKQWTFRGGVRTDIWDRGVPWARLLLERRVLSRANTLNLDRGERTKTAVVGLAVALLAVAMVSRAAGLAVLAAAALIAVTVADLPKLRWFAGQRGVVFSLLAVPMSVYYYFIGGVCVAIALGLHFTAGRDSRSALPMANSDDAANDVFARSILPMHKAAFGVAMGCVAAITLFVATAVTMVRGSNADFGIHLLSEYFAGYSVTWPGAFIGAGWAGLTGFVMGWFVAFTRNLSVAVMVKVVRTRAELAQTRDFLDHI